MTTKMLPVIDEPEVLDDVYEREIERLSHVDFDTLMDSWAMPPGPLFQICGPDGMDRKQPGGRFCGCLTEVKSEIRQAFTQELAALIRSDKRIPPNLATFYSAGWDKMPPAERRVLLRPFGQWQRYIDKHYRSK